MDEINQLPKQIQEAIKNNNLVIFAGAGLSERFNLPTWIQLVEDVINEINRKEFTELLPVLKSSIFSPIEVLEKLKSEHTIITRYIRDNFKITNGDFDLHKKILKLTDFVITTNYDNAFEEASQNTITPTIYTSPFNLSELNKNPDPYIFKLHGSYAESDNCIIFKKDYENLYNKGTAAIEKLKSIFTEKVILFIGFGFNDPDINILFKNLDKLFDNHNKHYLITKFPKEYNEFKFINSIPISEFTEIEHFIDTCIKFKYNSNNFLNKINFSSQAEVIEKIKIPRVALLFPSPIDIQLNGEIYKVTECFDLLDIELHIGTLNIKSLSLIEDYDILFIASQVFKTKIYIEDDNLKSNLVLPKEICENIPNEDIPVVFITDEKIDISDTKSTICISTLKRSTIKRFIFKALREKKNEFWR